MGSAPEHQDIYLVHLEYIREAIDEIRQTSVKHASAIEAHERKFVDMEAVAKARLEASKKNFERVDRTVRLVALAATILFGLLKVGAL